jgi:hypothetical protein
LELTHRTPAEQEQHTALAQNAVRNVLQWDPGVREQLRTAVREEQDRLDEEGRSRRETSLAESRRANLEELAKRCTSRPFKWSCSLRAEENHSTPTLPRFER